MEGLALILGPGFAVEGNEKLSSRLVGGRYRAPPFLLLSPSSRPVLLLLKDFLLSLRPLFLLVQIGYHGYPEIYFSDELVHAPFLMIKVIFKPCFG